MIPLIGYAEKLSVRPGETIRFHVSSDRAEPVETGVVRVICADANPAGPGIKVEPVVATVAEIAKPERQVVPLGSHAVVPRCAAIGGMGSFTAVVTVWIGGAAGMPGCIMAFGDLGRSSHRVLLSTMATANGICFAAMVGQGAAMPAEIASGDVEPEHWYTVVLTHDAEAASLKLSCVSHAGAVAPTEAAIRLGGPVTFEGVGDLRLAGGLPGGVAGTPTGCFNGRLERPILFGAALRPRDFNANGGSDTSSMIAAWDFSRDISSTRIVDIGPNGLHGTLVNQPTRAVTGSKWDGSEMSWKHAPQHYGAIHFHADDIDDCKWPATHEFVVPETLRTGVYALRLTAGERQDNIPFFVVPPKGRTTARIALLVSTFTYTVYGNHARPEWFADEAWKNAWKAQSKEWNAYPHNPGDHVDLGLSTYNFHTDGSGIAYASWRRPMLNLKIGYITYPYPDIRASGLRHFPADSHLTAWLEAKGLDYDIITDWELHHEGLELLKQYPVVMTGTHPEYHTREMIDALTQYRDHGGRFMYLGGNGFYWKIALSPETDGLVEIRRAEGGIRAWAAEVGEYYNAFDGEYGGMWRRNGRPPQKLAGVGFTAQGNFTGSYYRVLPEASDPRVAWMLAGIKDDTIGDFGLSGHGAAGFELDRTDKKLGTPRHAIVVARSEKHPPDAPWVLVPEEQLTHITTITGQSHKQLIHADMTFFETPGGGAVFSTGSITFCGSLPVNNFDNNVSKLLGNVVTRFLDPAPFAPAV